MFYFSKRMKFFLSVLVIIILILSIQIYTLLQEEPPIFTELENLQTGLDQEAVQQPQVLGIDLKGAIKQPNLYYMSSGDRIRDVIDKAGGILEDADLSQINLAKRLCDQMSLYIPKKDEHIKEGIIKGCVGTGEEEEQMKLDESIAVDIKGAVKKPDLYYMNKGDRMKDVIELAGGATTEADLIQINLAMKVYDQMLIYVPRKGEDITKILNEIHGGKISINQGGVEELSKLDGIGTSKAQAIIDYREKNGYFRITEDIINVPGIGDKTFQNIRDKITLN